MPQDAAKSNDFERDLILADRRLEQAVVLGEQVALARVADVLVHRRDTAVLPGATALERDLAQGTCDAALHD